MVAVLPPSPDPTLRSSNPETGGSWDGLEPGDSLHSHVLPVSGAQCSAQHPDRSHFGSGAPAQTLARRGRALRLDRRCGALHRAMGCSSSRASEPQPARSRLEPRSPVLLGREHPGVTRVRFAAKGPARSSDDTSTVLWRTDTTALRADMGPAWRHDCPSSQPVLPQAACGMAGSCRPRRPTTLGPPVRGAARARPPRRPRGPGAAPSARRRRCRRPPAASRRRWRR